MSDSPLITAIIPAYNSRECIARCVNSILLQTYKNVEIVIIDDCSTDDTHEILLKIARRSRRIKIAKTRTNSGSGVARNLGLKFASGEFITFIDSDDYITSDCIYELVKNILNEKADIVIGGYYQINNGKIYKRKLKPIVCNKIGSLSAYLSRDAGFYNIWSAIYNADFIKSNKIFFSDTYSHQDMVFALQAFSKSRKTAIIPSIGYVHVLSKESMSMRTTVREHDFKSMLVFFQHLINVDFNDYDAALRAHFQWGRNRMYISISSSTENFDLFILFLQQHAQLLKVILFDLLDIYLAESILFNDEMQHVACNFSADTYEKFYLDFKSKLYYFEDDVIISRLCSILANRIYYYLTNDKYPDLDDIMHYFIEDVKLTSALLVLIISKYEENENVIEMLPKKDFLFGTFENIMEIPNTSPILTVVVACYNSQKFISKCLDSILKSTFTGFELIIVDDASVDGTKDILEFYKNNYSSIQLIHNSKNIGPGPSRNLAIDKSNGKYITFVDADDMVAPDFFMNCLSILENNEKIDIVACSWKKISSDGKILARAVFQNDRLVAGLDTFKDYCQSKHSLYTAWAKIFRLKLINDHAIKFSDNYFEENIFLLKAYFNSCFVYYCSDIAYLYFQEQSSTMNRASSVDHLVSILQVAFLTENFFIENVDPALCKLLDVRLRKGVLGVFKERASSFLSTIPNEYVDINIPDKCIEYLSGSVRFYKIILEELSFEMSKKYNYEFSLPDFEFDPNYTAYPTSVPVFEKFTQQNKIDGERCFFSIIIPVYNSEKLIDKAVGSIVSQNFNNIQIIIIDDCSTDSSLDVALDLCEKNDCIEVYRSDVNRGQGPLRNFGISISRGAYILFLDSDDILCPNILHNAYQYLTTKNSDIICFSHIDKFKNNASKFVNFPTQVVDGKFCFSEYIAGNICKYAPWNIYYKKSFLETFEIKFGVTDFEDNIFLTKAFYYAKEVHFSNKIGYIRNVRNNSSTRKTTFSLRLFFGALSKLKDLTDFFKEQTLLDAGSDLYLQRVGRFFEYRKREIFLYLASYINYFNKFPMADIVNEYFLCSKFFIKLILVEYASILHNCESKYVDFDSNFSSKESSAFGPNKEHEVSLMPNIEIIKAHSVNIDKIQNELTADHYEIIKKSTLFDCDWYLKKNPEILEYNIDPIYHYLILGWLENKDPSASFSTKGYLNSNQDVLDAGMNPLVHYEMFGKIEGRTWC